MKKLVCTIDTWDLTQQRVIVRADLNVPLDNGTIVSDHRLRAIQPTLNVIAQKKGSIILITHLGRPQQPTPDLSTQLLIPWFKNHGYTIQYAATLEQARTKIVPEGTILLLENIRFFKGEETKDMHFAQQLAALGNYYVDDAFGSLHRDHTSLTVLPTLFAPDKRSIGLLVQQELEVLNKLLHTPAQPFVALIGGGKLQDKLAALEHLLPHIDTLLLCPAAVFTFLQAQGKPVGKSLVDSSLVQTCNSLSERAQKLGKKIMVPDDYVVARESFTGTLSTLDANNFAPWAVGISIGPATITAWTPIIHQAETLFYCGLMGDVKRKETLTGAHAIFSAMAQSPGFSVISGGDSVGAAELLHLADDIDFCSTGGSSTLAYLSGKQLPGLTVFLSR
jgi:phosphoglycerate kinase